MKKFIKVFFLVILGFMIYSNHVKKEYVKYLPFDIPGKQLSATIPPFGIFIEERYKDDGGAERSEVQLFQ